MTPSATHRHCAHGERRHPHGAPSGGRLSIMTAPDWATVDDYIVAGVVDDPQTTAALRANAEAGLPAIDVSPAQGKFLHLLARSVGARRVLEIGTLGGFSTIWLARAVGEEGPCSPSSTNRGTPRWRAPTSTRRASATGSRSGWARRWTASPCCWRRGPPRSIWCSSTPTRSTTRRRTPPRRDRRADRRFEGLGRLRLRRGRGRHRLLTPNGWPRRPVRG